MLALKTIYSKLEGDGVGVMVPTLDIRADERKTQIRRRKENFLAWGSINSTPLSSQELVVVSASTLQIKFYKTRDHTKVSFLIIFRFFLTILRFGIRDRDFYNLISDETFRHTRRRCLRPSRCPSQHGPNGPNGWWYDGRYDVQPTYAFSPSQGYVTVKFHHSRFLTYTF